jgi:hypothetical protein
MINNYGEAEGYDSSLYVAHVGGRAFIISYAREAIPVDQIKNIDFYFPEANQVTVYTNHKHIHFKDENGRADATALRQLFLKKSVKPPRPIPGSGVERGKGKLAMGG